MTLFDVEFEVTDTEWTEQVAERLRSLDDLQSERTARAVAQELCGRSRWRHLSPDAAAQKAFDEPEAVDGV